MVARTGSELAEQVQEGSLKRDTVTSCWDGFPRINFLEFESVGWETLNFGVPLRVRKEVGAVVSSPGAGCEDQEHHCRGTYTLKMEESGASCWITLSTTNNLIWSGCLTERFEQRGLLPTGWQIVATCQHRLPADPMTPGSKEKGGRQKEALAKSHSVAATRGGLMPGRMCTAPNSRA